MSLKGIDVSHYQPVNPDPATLPSLAGITFYIAKATQGATPDTTYATHIAHAREHHIPIVGAYHFGVNAPALMQVNAFLAAAGNVDIYALDIEGRNTMTEPQGRSFIAGMHSHGKKVTMYGSEYGFPHWGQDYNWVANYSREPNIPYNFWQYGPAAPNVDGDIFKGSIEQLYALAGKVINPDRMMLYLSGPVDVVNYNFVKVGGLHSGTRLISSPLVKMHNGYYYYKILSGPYTGRYIHSGKLVHAVKMPNA